MGQHKSLPSFDELKRNYLGPSTNPLTVHIPGQSRSGPVVFCWEEGEDSVCFGHPLGEEQEARRPLKLKAI